jgi:hypothetical protein
MDKAPPPRPSQLTNRPPPHISRPASWSRALTDSEAARPTHTRTRPARTPHQGMDGVVDVSNRAHGMREAHTNTDSRMSPDLPRCMGKSIGGDLEIDDEGSKQCRFEPVQSLHYGSVGYQPVRT